MYELVSQPELGSPVMVVSLRGFVDAGLGAATAVDSLRGQINPVVVARFDDDALIDYRSRRPVLHLTDGVNKGLTWDPIDMVAGHDVTGTALLLLDGVEPDRHWRPFASAVLDLAQQFGVRMLVGLGAYPAPMPHTRPVRLASSANRADLAQEVGFLSGSLDVPASIQAVLEQEAASRDMAAVGIWAAVPHYAATLPYAAASVALLEGLTSLTGLQFDTATLRDAAAANLARLTELVEADPQHTEVLAALERHADAMEEAQGTQLPSGEELAEEIRRFLDTQEGS
jgi:predicted ATP-grasp superfamily ATP-dependent carboligase